MTDLNDFNATLIDEFRANNGAVTGMFERAPLVLVTHTGAKTGKKRTSPLAFTRDGDRIVIIASKGGAPTHPHWYLNMVANPTVHVELPGESFDASVSEATGAERERLYRAQAAILPNFDDYEKATTRSIPVLVLTRSTPTTQQVLDRHMATLLARDIDGVMADYAPNCFIITGDRVVRGLDKVRKMFEGIPAGMADGFEITRQVVHGEIAIIDWKSARVPFGTDTFVIRNGKIVAQTVAHP